MNCRVIILLLAGAILNGCAAQLAGSTSTAAHSENLSAYRPKIVVDSSKKETPVIASAEKVYVANPVLNVNKKVDAVLDSIDGMNRARKFVDGYTLQIYSGTNREEAMDTKKRMSYSLPEVAASLHYDQPKFRVTAGSYFSRLEAQKDLISLKHHFPNAILVPERVPIR